MCEIREGFGLSEYTFDDWYYSALAFMQNNQ